MLSIRILLVSDDMYKVCTHQILFLHYTLSIILDIAVQLLVYIAVLRRGSCCSQHITVDPESSRKETQHDGFPPGIKSIIILLYAQVNQIVMVQLFRIAIIYAVTNTTTTRVSECCCLRVD